MTLSQIFALLSADTALNSAAAYVFAIRTPHGTLRTTRFFIATVIGLGAVTFAVIALEDNSIQSSPRTPAYLYQASPWLVFVTAALLLFSVLLLGYAFVKGPQNPPPI